MDNNELNENIVTPETEATPQIKTKFCKHCGGKIPEKAVICTLCGCQVEDMNQGAQAQPNIIINNSNTNTNTNIVGVGRPKNKWVAFCLCFFLGFFGAHKFYEGKIMMGILYLFTCGLCGVGYIVDCIMLLLKPNPYYV